MSASEPTMKSDRRSMLGAPPADYNPNLSGRHIAGLVFQLIAVLAILAGLLMLGVLIFDVFRDGANRLDWQFLSSFPSRRPDDAGILAALAGTAFMISIMAFIFFPVGVGAGLYLEEFAPKNWIATVINVNITNLAGVPSIIYGLLGLEVFTRMLRGFTGGRSVLSGALTIGLLVLPIIIVATREAARAVPQEMRLGALAVGATPWQAVRSHVLPYAMPGILTGTILAISRAIGEAAPLIAIGALAFVAYVPTSPQDGFTTLPIQIFNWTSRPQPEFAELAAAGIIVLLAILLAMNSIAILLRNRFQRKW